MHGRTSVWVSGVAALVLFSGLAWYLTPLHPSILVLQLAFDAQSFGSVIHAWPAEHLHMYRNHLAVDGVLLCCYGTFGYLLATRTEVFVALNPLLSRSARWCLPLAAVLDAGENGLHGWLTEVPRFGVRWVYPLTASCSLGKWVFLLLFGLLVAVALLLNTRELRHNSAP